MRIPRNQTMAALIVLIAGMSTIQAAGALIGSVSAENAFTIQTVGTIVSIEPSSATITAGAFAKFEVSIINNSSADVSLVAQGVPADSVAIFTPNVGVANPDLNSSLTIVTSAQTPQGNYLVTAVAIVNGTEYTNELNLQVLPSPSVTVTTNSTSTNTALNTTLGETLSMAIYTDQSQYEPNSTVDVHGQVSDTNGNAVADATVALQIDTPSGTQLFYTNNIRTDSAGTFQVQVPLGPDTPSGAYTVFASATKTGYSSITGRTAFVVGTSSTPSVIIKAVYAGDSVGNPTSVFASGQSIWIWVVIQNIGSSFQGVLWIQVRDPNGVPVQIQTRITQLAAGQTLNEGLEVNLPGNATIGVYTVNALVSDKLISQGGTFLASSETQFALTG